MTPQDFQKLLQTRMDKTANILSSKSAEYAFDNDKLFNFKAAARIDNITSEQALWGMFLKHLVSVQDLVKGRKKPSVSLIDEKIGDAINYLCLLEAIFIEKITDKEERA